MVSDQALVVTIVTTIGLFFIFGFSLWDLKKKLNDAKNPVVKLNVDKKKKLFQTIASFGLEDRLHLLTLIFGEGEVSLRNTPQGVILTGASKTEQLENNQNKLREYTG